MRRLTDEERGRLLDLDVIEEARRLRQRGIPPKDAVLLALDSCKPAAPTAPPTVRERLPRPSERAVNSAFLLHVHERHQDQQRVTRLSEALALTFVVLAMAWALFA
jgi:hypothetical protein